MVLGRERGALVLDDTEGVWPRHRDNLVLIERYLYFPADAARFGFGCAQGREGDGSGGDGGGYEEGSWLYARCASCSC